MSKSESELKNIASERAVLAGICHYGTECLIEVDPFLEEDTFTIDNNKVLYKCLKQLCKKQDKPDFVGILSSANDLGLSEYINKPDTLKHIRGVMATPIDIAVVSKHAKKIRRLQFARNLQDVMRQNYVSLNKITGEESLSEIVQIVEEPIQDASVSYLKNEDNRPKVLGDDIFEYLKVLETGESAAIGISSGIAGFDEAIGGGFLRGCVDLIGARSKAGKSLLADNIAIHVCLTLGIPVLMLDTEMTTEDHKNRILACLSGITINEIKNGTFASDPAKTRQVMEAAEKMSRMKYHYVNVVGKSFEEILGIAKRWILKDVGLQPNGRTNNCLIIYDYFKLMSSEGINASMQEYQMLGFQATKMHNFCVEHDCPCLAFVQLNRDGLSTENEAAVAGSDRLIWLCTSFSIYKAKSPEEIAEDGVRAGNRKLVPIVSRHGPGLGDNGYICLQMDGDIARIREIGTIRSIKRNRDFPENNEPEEEAEDES